MRNSNSKSVIVIVNSNSNGKSVTIVICVILYSSPAPFFLLPKKGLRIYTYNFKLHFKKVCLLNLLTNRAPVGSHKWGANSHFYATKQMTLSDHSSIAESRMNCQQQRKVKSWRENWEFVGLRAVSGKHR